jgi:MFS family permease
MLAVSGTVTGLLLVEFYRQSTNAQLGHAEEAVVRSCRELADLYQSFANSCSLMSACIVAAQVIMVPMAILVGRKANRWGRKPLFLAGFLILPIRGVLYTFSDEPLWLVGVQLLDGVGAGLYGALFPLIVSDLTTGTGRFNLALGAMTTAQGIGASLSTTLAGLIVVKAGYSAAFLTLAVIAGAGLALFWLAMPETWRSNESAGTNESARQSALAQAAE